MESRYYKDDLKDMILDMAHKELGNLLSQKGAQKYFEGNIDKVINNYIKKISDDSKVNRTYLKVLKNGSYQENMVSIGKMIRNQELFKTKRELIKFAKYLGLNVNPKNSSYILSFKNVNSSNILRAEPLEYFFIGKTPVI